jgi:hypothetical protein
MFTSYDYCTRMQEVCTPSTHTPENDDACKGWHTSACYRDERTSVPGRGRLGSLGSQVSLSRSQRQVPIHLR